MKILSKCIEFINGMDESNHQYISFSRAMLKVIDGNVVSRKSWDTRNSLYEGILNRYIYMDILDNGTKIIKDVKSRGS